MQEVARLPFQMDAATAERMGSGPFSCDSFPGIFSLGNVPLLCISVHFAVEFDRKLDRGLRVSAFVYCSNQSCLGQLLVLLSFFSYHCFAIHFASFKRNQKHMKNRRFVGHASGCGMFRLSLRIYSFFRAKVRSR